jgi:hypothetical protein
VQRLLIASLAALIGSSAIAKGRPHTIFGSEAALELRLEAPFATLFTHNYEDDYWVDGRLTYVAGGHAVDEPVEVGVRGNSSKDASECTFPKLKLRGGGHTFKIGTHCGERADGDLTPQLGRWANEKSPRREALVYTLLSAVGLTALEARPARITYVFTGESRQREPLTRDAMLLEDDDEAIARLGGRGAVEQFTNAADLFERDAALDAAFGEAMVGNLDWCLTFDAGDAKRCDAHVPIYNLLAIQLDDRAVPVLYDFDLSGMVAGRREWFVNGVGADFKPPRAAIEAEILGQLQRMRSFYSRAELDAARRRFLRRMRDAYAAVAAHDVDAIGRRIITAYLDAFFAILKSDERFYG